MLRNKNARNPASPSVNISNSTVAAVAASGHSAKAEGTIRHGAESKNEHISQRARVKLKGLLGRAEPRWPRSPGMGLSNQAILSGQPAPLFDSVNQILQERVGLDLARAGCSSTADACLKLAADDLLDFLDAVRDCLIDEALRTSSRTVPVSPEEFDTRVKEILRSTDSGDASVEETGKRMSNILVFVSHSAKDKDLGQALLNCLEASIQLPGDDVIRCTSADGYRLAPGDNADDVLRSDLENCKVVIGLITEDSLNSSYVSIELGAAWGLRKRTCLALTAEIGFDRLPGPLKNQQAVRLDSPEQLTHMMQIIAEQIGVNMRPPARSSAGVNHFVKTAGKILSARKRARTSRTRKPRNSDEKASDDKEGIRFNCERQERALNEYTRLVAKWSTDQQHPYSLSESMSAKHERKIKEEQELAEDTNILYNSIALAFNNKSFAGQAIEVIRGLAAARGRILEMISAQFLVSQYHDEMLAVIRDSYALLGHPKPTPIKSPIPPEAFQRAKKQLLLTDLVSRAGMDPKLVDEVLNNPNPSPEFMQELLRKYGKNRGATAPAAPSPDDE